jgi:hypothetical protein
VGVAAELGDADLLAGDRPHHVGTGDEHPALVPVRGIELSRRVEVAVIEEVQVDGLPPQPRVDHLIGLGWVHVAQRRYGPQPLP